jgi:hypothetical protein
MSFSPNIEIRIPKRRSITVSGMLDYMTSRKVDVNLVMENLFTTPVTIKGRLEHFRTRKVNLLEQM